MHRRSSSPELLELELLDTEVTARAPRRADEVLSVENLSARLGRRVVIRDVDLHVCAGEIVALVGHNGSGKTTTLRAVAGLTAAERGVVDIAGDRTVRYVPTERSVFADLSVRDNLWLGAGRATPAVRAARAEAALTLFPELGRRLNAQARMLSGGEQQMVVLAQAIVSQPRFVLPAPTQPSRSFPSCAAASSSAPASSVAASSDSWRSRLPSWASLDCCSWTNPRSSWDRRRFDECSRRSVA